MNRAVGFKKLLMQENRESSESISTTQKDITTPLTTVPTTNFPTISASPILNPTTIPDSPALLTLYTQHSFSFGPMFDILYFVKPISSSGRAMCPRTYMRVQIPHRLILSECEKMTKTELYINFLNKTDLKI